MPKAYTGAHRASIGNGHSANGVAPPDFRSPPHNIEAEIGLLGSILKDPEVLPPLAPFLRPTDFLREDHETLCRVLLGMREHALAPIDFAMAAEDALVASGWDPRRATELMGGILEATAHSLNATFYAQVVIEKAKAREVLFAGRRLADAVESMKAPAEQLIAAATAELEAIRSRPVPGHGEESRAFSLDLLESGTFFREVFTLDWLVQGIVVQNEPGAIGGPMKSLKTSILVDLMISLGSATPFLGRFAVARPFRVALISGESGRRAIQSSARQVCLAREIYPADAGVHWGFKLPRLTDREHMNVLRKTIDDNGIECIGLDPFYLMILAGSAGVDTSNMFQMGPMLQDVASLCLEEGCTPIFAHHFTKKRDDPFASPELSDLAYAGIGQFMRQWMLVSPRQQFDAEIGKFYLHFRYGGSAGHCGEFAVDIEVGKLEPDFDDRKWAVSIAKPSEERQAKAEERKAEVERKAVERREVKEVVAQREEAEAQGIATAVLVGEPDHRITVNRLMVATRWGRPKAGRILFLLEQAGKVRPVEVEAVSGNGTARKCPGFELIGDGRLDA